MQPSHRFQGRRPDPPWRRGREPRAAPPPGAGAGGLRSFGVTWGRFYGWKEPTRRQDGCGTAHMIRPQGGSSHGDPRSTSPSGAPHQDPLAEASPGRPTTSKVKLDIWIPAAVLSAHSWNALLPASFRTAFASGAGRSGRGFGALRERRSLPADVEVWSSAPSMGSIGSPAARSWKNVWCRPRSDSVNPRPFRRGFFDSPDRGRRTGPPVRGTTVRHLPPPPRPPGPHLLLVHTPPGPTPPDLGQPRFLLSATALPRDGSST